MRSRVCVLTILDSAGLTEIIYSISVDCIRVDVRFITESTMSRITQFHSPCFVSVMLHFLLAIINNDLYNLNCLIDRVRL